MKEYVDKEALQEFTTKLTNKYKTIFRGDYVTPQMFGAKADGTTDDTTAIQSAVNSGKSVYFPVGSYKTTETITIDSKQMFSLDASGATINYTGASYAFLIQRVQFSTLKFGKITAPNGGCIKLFTERANNQGENQYDYLTYNSIYFEDLSASTDCIFANSTLLGWINENRFFGGRFSGGANGFRFVHNSSNGSSHNKFFNIGLEGVTVGFNFSLGSAAITAEKLFTDYEFYGLRTGEATTIFSTDGKCTRFLISGGYALPAAKCSFSQDSDQWTVITPESFQIVRNGELMEIDQLELAQLSAHTDIPASTDLETLTGLGTYTCNGTTTAKSLSNCPVQTAFNMVVKNLIPNKSYTGNSYYRVRELYPINTTGTFYRQVITSSNKGSTWTINPWYSFSGTQV